MACYSGTTVSIARTVTWHALESFWDDLSGQSPIMQILREINIREEQVGLAKTAWIGAGADPADGAATTAAKHNAKDGAVWWVQAMDAMLLVLNTSGTVGSDGIRWTITGVSSTRTAFLASVGSSSGTRLANAKLEDRWKMILTALRVALDAIDEKVSTAWSGDFVTIEVSAFGTASRSGYKSSWNSACKVERPPVPGGGADVLAFDWRGGAGGNSFNGISTPHDEYESVSFSGQTMPAGGFAGELIEGDGLDESALCVGHTFHADDEAWTAYPPDDDGFIFGDPGDSGDVAALAAYNEVGGGAKTGWYCCSEFAVDISYTIFCYGTLAPGTVIEVAALFTSVAVAGISNEADGAWDDSDYYMEHDEADALGTHAMGERTLSMTAANVTTAPDASAYDTPTAGNFSAAAAQCGIVANGSAPLLWVDGVVSGGTDDLGYIKLPACVDALGRYHLE